MYNESQIFTQCDKFLKQLTRKAKTNPKIMKIKNTDKNLLQNLIKNNETLDLIEKNMEEFLDSKR